MGVFERSSLDFLAVVGGDDVFPVAIVFVVVESEEVFTWLLSSDEAAFDEFGNFGGFAGEHGAGFDVYR